jgi:predicted RNA-binding Zn ribbon-like protein
MNDLRQRTRGKLIQNAIFSPLSALLIAAGIILVGLQVPIPVLTDVLGVPPVAWLAGIVPLWLGVVGANVASKSAGEQAVSQVLREQFDVNRITTPSLRMNVGQAIAYRERIDKAVTRFADSGMQGRMQDVANQVEEWVRSIYALSSRLDAFQHDSVIKNDLQSVPDSIKKLKQRLNNEDNEAIRHELNDTIARRQAQYNSLLKLETTMERAELQLENTLTALGTVYSQMLLVDAKDVDSSKAQRLRDNIAEQVNSLQDVLSSMDEVYAGDGLDQQSRSRANMGAQAQ